MNINAKKYIWSVYILIWIYFIFFDSSYEQSDHIFSFLIFGWIPFLALHLIWKKNSSTDQSMPPLEKEDDLDKNYSLLYPLISKEEMLEVGSLDKQFQPALQQANEEMDAFLKKYGRDMSFFTNHEALDLEVEVLEEFFRLGNQLKDLQLADFKVGHFSERMGIINEELKKGVGIDEAQKKLDEMITKHNKEEAEILVKWELSKAIGDELVGMKRLYGKDFKDKKINWDDITKRVYEKHPEWKNDE